MALQLLKHNSELLQLGDFFGPLPTLRNEHPKILSARKQKTAPEVVKRKQNEKSP